MAFKWNYIKHKEGYEHRLIAEKALGFPLPKGAEVHHLGDQRDNAALVICNSRAHHMEIHRRQRAYLECGDANKAKCVYCKKYDDPENLYIRRERGSRKSFEARHRSCHVLAEARRKARK